MAIWGNSEEIRFNMKYMIFQVRSQFLSLLGVGDREKPYAVASLLEVNRKILTLSFSRKLENHIAAKLKRMSGYID